MDGLIGLGVMVDKQCCKDKLVKLLIEIFVSTEIHQHTVTFMRVVVEIVSSTIIACMSNCP